ncbi:amidohydrolase family protein [Frigoribacterium sp. NBH87]|uniref:metal-dependent hydrolase family protein n=1 Tax=Frigoribacterium sp. NBH87 TaxID=2596916 RepID=UPI001625BC79|nr:amidohydrolase family protein [Frigoribacterium sp. NBH87]QNE42923.1 amidohydrolase family protein [Frigoribacterium sp. NBH87]
MLHHASPTSLAGVDVWDGHGALGPSTVSWGPARPGIATDAVVTEVEPAEPSARFEGLSLVPGLVDTHVHLIGNAGGASSGFLTWPLVTPPTEQVLHGLAHARRALAGGVTTLRDLSADEVQFSLARAVEAGLVEAPRILAHGMVSMTGGHGDMFVPPGVDPRLRKPTADGVDACRALVRTHARAGATGIKIATSGGLLSEGDAPSWRNHTSAEIDAIVDEAHALGLLVAAHAHTAEGIRVALRAGVDSIEHATQLDGDLARQVVAAGLPIAPTLLINDAIAEGSVPVSAEQRETAAALVATRDPAFRAAAEVGVDFVLGTDANGFHVAFGDQMRELRRMGDVFGWSPERVLRAGTSRAAAAIGRSTQLGRVAVGAAADFVLLRGRPWEDAAALDPDAIVAVVARGRVVAGALPAA